MPRGWMAVGGHRTGIGTMTVGERKTTAVSQSCFVSCGEDLTMGADAVGCGRRWNGCEQASESLQRRQLWTCR
jgi:hypothetical protein